MFASSLFHNQSSMYESPHTLFKHAQALTTKLHTHQAEISKTAMLRLSSKSDNLLTASIGILYCRRAGQHPPNLQKLYPAHAKRVRKAPQRYTGVRTPVALQKSHSGEHSRPTQPRSHSGTSQYVSKQLISPLSHSRFLGETGDVRFKGGPEGQYEQHGTTTGRARCYGFISYANKLNVLQVTSGKNGGVAKMLQQHPCRCADASLAGLTASISY